MSSNKVIWRLLLPIFLLSAIAMSVRLGVQDPKTARFCILLEADINGTVHYLDKSGVERVSAFSVPDKMPTHVEKTRSRCGASFQKMVVEFLPDGFNNTEQEADHLWWYLTMEFNETNAKDHYSLTNYSLSVEFFDSQNASLQYNRTYNYVKAPSFKPEWGASVAQSKSNAFGCSQNALSLTNQSSLVFKNLKVVAFSNLSSVDFKGVPGVEQCLLDQRTSDLIPIIVGACLAGLVVVVLIAYLIGRARAKRQGYASV